MANRFDLQIVGSKRQLFRVDGKLQPKSVRRVIGNLTRYDKEVIRGVQREVDKAEPELMALARAAAPQGTAKRRKGRVRLRGSIRKRRRGGDVDRGIIQGGIVARARHALAVEGGTKKKAARPFFYRQLDVVFPKFEAGVRRVLIQDAVRKAIIRG